MAKDWLDEPAKTSPTPDKPGQEVSPVGDNSGGDGLDTALDKTGTFAEHMVGAVPGGTTVLRKIDQGIEKLTGGAGDEQAIARQMAARTERNPGTALGGDVAGFVTSGALLPGSGATTLAGKAAAAATTAVLLTPAYKLGEVADQAALKNSPISVEQIHQAFSFDDILQSAGLAAAADVTLHGAGHVLAKVGPKLEAMAESQAAKLFKKAPSRTGMSAADLGEKALDEALFTPEAAQAKLDQVSARFDSLKGSLDADAGKLVARNIAARLAGHIREHEQFALDGPRKYIAKVAQKLADVQDKYVWDGAAVHDQLNMLSTKARTVKDHSIKAFLNDALEFGREEFATGLETVSPETGQEWRSALSDWKIYSNMEKDLRTAPQQVAVKDLAATGMGAAAILGGNSMGGPMGGTIGAALAYGATKTGVIVDPMKANRARLYQQFSKVAPGAGRRATLPLRRDL
jgi:hypothetical protein